MVSRELTIGLLLWARGAPLFLLGPYVAIGQLPGVLAWLLSAAFAGVMLPWALLVFPGDILLVGSLESAVLVELARGFVVALGCSLPLAALRLAGGVAESLIGPAHAAAVSGKLARLCGLAGVVSVATVGGLAGTMRFVLGMERTPPLGGELVSVEALRAACWELVLLGLRAFTLGVSLCAPLLLGAVAAALVLGVLGRVLGARAVSPLGAGVGLWLVVLGLSLALVHWLAALPEQLRAFAGRAARLLAGIP